MLWVGCVVNVTGLGPSQMPMEHQLAQINYVDNFFHKTVEK
jgi:hypothetical protein